MKIAILGGSFDPPHLGHFLIASQVKELLHMDEVWLMPLYEKTHQDKIFHKSMSPATDRLTMAKMLENDYIKISDFEIQHNKESYSINTLRSLQKLHPNDTFFWITGSDQLEGFHKYYQWQELLKTQNLIIFPREHMLWNIEEAVKKGLNLKTIPQNVIVLQDKKLVLTNISSTRIRERLKEDLSIDLLVSKDVEKYIREHKLYK